ncbi:MAG TPA: hypothetical protein VHT30_01385 [Acidimicrobiales bacterium]|nr:hypothetical protein [Acidimicrobiales bacterium]
MSDVDSNDNTGRRPRLRDALGGIALFAQLKHLSSDEYTPEGVPALNEGDMAVFNAAQVLASDHECSDADAVAELVRVAGRHHHRLRKSEIASHRSGRNLDSAVADRTQRLLEAAVTGQAVTVPSALDRRRFEVVQSFRALPRDQAWEQLVVAVPQLAVLAFDIPTHLLNRSVPPEAVSEAARDASARLQDLRSRLDELLGPKSGQSDPLLSSTYARQFAVEYLIQRQTPFSETGPNSSC